MAVVNWVSLGQGKSDQNNIANSVISSLLPIPPLVIDSRDMRKYWEENLLGDGWIKGLMLKKSRLGIGYVKDQVGLCIQLGNTSRVYADLLKLETLFRQELIQQAVLVVPSDDYSTSLGTNYAKFSRAEQDIKALTPTISVPIVLVSIDNRRGA